MPGPSGFVQRIKGKVQVDTTQVGKGGVNEYVYGIVDAAVTPGATIPNNGLSLIKCSSAPQVLVLAAPEPGVEKTIVVTSQSSGALALKTNSTSTVTYDGVNAIWKPSTGVSSSNSIAMVLVGLSTTQWGFLGVSASTANNVTGLVATS